MPCDSFHIPGSVNVCHVLVTLAHRLAPHIGRSSLFGVRGPGFLRATALRLAMMDHTELPQSLLGA